MGPVQRRFPPTAHEIERARDDWSEHLDDLRTSLGDDPSPEKVRLLLEWGGEQGASTSEVQRLTVAVWGLSHRDAVHGTLLAAAGRQWTDGELEALLAHLGHDEPTVWLEQHALEVQRARLLARGHARNVFFGLLSSADHAVRLRAVRDFLRQHGGHTSRGYAGDVQAELEALEREAGRRH